MTKKEERIHMVRKDLAYRLHVMVDRVCGFSDQELSRRLYELGSTRDAKLKAIEESDACEGFPEFLFDETERNTLRLLKTCLIHSEFSKCKACGRLYSIDFETVCRHCGADVTEKEESHG